MGLQQVGTPSPYRLDLLSCDLEEWVYARLGFATFPSFLATLPAEAKLVGLPWLLFGSNLTVAQPSSVIDTFVTRAPTRASRMELKGIVRRSELCTPIATRSKRRPSAAAAEFWANVKRACGDAECCVEHQHRSSFTAVQSSIFPMASPRIIGLISGALSDLCVTTRAIAGRCT